MADPGISIQDYKRKQMIDSVGIGVYNIQDKTAVPRITTNWYKESMCDDIAPDFPAFPFLDLGRK